MLGKALTTAAAGNAAGEATYVEDVFSTYLHEGTNADQTITNGVNLEEEGGLVWVKNRGFTTNHQLSDTERGLSGTIESSTTSAQYTRQWIKSVSTDGFVLDGSVGGIAGSNDSAYDYASWTFRKAPKFFDVVTYTGNGVAGHTISHNLGSVPGCIIVKSTSNAYEWPVYHRGADSTSPENYRLKLNETNAAATNSVWNNTAPTDTEFTVGTASEINLNGGTFVAYLFAHNDDDGEFGEDSDQDIIKCGSYTGNSSTLPNTISLGFEPQWVMVKKSNGTSDWAIWDIMRGMSLSSNAEALEPNTADAESTTGNIIVYPTADGFEFNDASDFANINGGSYIYIAIRRGPMKTPESGTEVFNPVVYTGDNTSDRLIDTSLVTDAIFVKERNDTQVYGMHVTSRLTDRYYLKTSETAIEIQSSIAFLSPAFDSMSGVFVGNDPAAKLNSDTASNNHVAHAFRRAPGFFDVVAYEGTGSATTINHNLGVAPELMIIKSRDVTRNWAVYAGDETDYLVLNKTDSSTDNDNYWNDTAPTSSVFTVGVDTVVNNSGENYIAYLFATLPGVSKVGSYTGTGADLNVDCGFSSGARYVLVKRTDGAGSWFVWDSARGIVAGNDPYARLNLQTAESTGSDYIDPNSSGFTITSTAIADLNASGGTYIFLAIA